MKTHDEVMRLLSHYDRLSAGERADVDEHLAGCPVCAARLAIFQHIDRERATSETASRRESSEERRPALARPLLALGVITLVVVAWLAARGDLLMLPRLETLLHPAPAPIATPAPTLPPRPTLTPEPTAETGVPPDSIAWLQKQAVTFRGAEPGGDLGDLAPLERMIGQARIVVISDPTFGGTHETLAMRQRLLELLVERMGFGTVLVEIPWEAGDQINTYIQGGAGVPENLLPDASMSQTQEWLYTLRWLREHNADPAAKTHVTLAGFLPSSLQPGTAALDAVSAFMYKVDPRAQSGARSSYQQLLEWLQAHRDLYVARSSQKEYDHALLAAQSLAQYEQLEAANAQQRGGLAGPFKLSNLDILLGDVQNERVLVWRITGDPMLASSGNNSYLRLRYGSQAVFITFALYRGAIFAYPSTWPDIGTPLVRAVHTLPAAPAGSYEAWLHAAGMPRLILDMRAGQDEASRLPALRYTRSLRAGLDDCYPEDNFVTGSPADEGDVLVFFDQATPPTFLSPAEPAPPRACPSGPQNLDFAQGTQGWYTADAAQEYEIGADGGAGTIKARAAEPGRLSSGVLAQNFRADDYRGKRVKLTLVAGTEAAVAASLWLEADRPAFQSQAYISKPLPGVAPEQPYELVVDVPEDAIRITFGVQLHGQGKVTVRDVTFEVVK